MSDPTPLSSLEIIGLLVVMAVGWIGIVAVVGALMGALAPGVPAGRKRDKERGRQL